MDEDLVREFLQQVGAAGDKASLQEVGSALGIDRGQAEELSMQLMGEGLLEIVSLSGAVRLTDAGRTAAGGSSGGGATAEDLPSLVAEIAAAGSLGLAPDQADDLTRDLAALTAQLKRSRPLGDVIKTLLKAVEEGLTASPEPQARALAMRLKAAQS